ncbi:zinc metallopeptidase [Salinibius halmophilus]|uniref:zinc metallopeptidase n=1 Tax=Salinibius halmophilus TaxID=1853216 RepID=UPI000E663880|nr:zinc metallopeptidase [Salinibius halmophilus]
MIFLLFIGVFVLLMMLPQWLVKRRMKKYHQIDDSLEGTGGELARHLIDRFQLPVKIKPGAPADYYDPQAKLVALSQENYKNRSITAIAVAAHEVSHAMQDQKGWTPFVLRQQWAPVIAMIQSITAMVTSVGTLLIWLPGMAILWRLMIIALIIAGVTRLLFHLLTLPVEIHASYKLALPLLAEYIPQEKLGQARKVLQAAAYTYVAQAMADFVNIGIWLRLLRR